MLRREVPDPRGRLTFEWQTVSSWDRAAEVDARTLLGRFGCDAVHYDNCRITEAGRLPAQVKSWTPLTEYTGDAGFVVVTPEEVGVFWSFYFVRGRPSCGESSNSHPRTR
ncbi:hypothetical protein ABZX85_37035 [Streptomyces sp. NPDC004539]|uniref:hypothetical protein n=1 Tax=Streptomyces sp. NPDC004539 TaxID=3154280 RepID=UPI0033BA8906